MDSVFLGTGAAEGVPAVYCSCEVCNGVRERKGREIKTRSSLRIGDKYQIDVSPDYYWQMLKLGLEMSSLEYVLITHSHGDHCSLSGMTDKLMAREGSSLLNVYLSNPAKDFIERVFGSRGEAGSRTTRFSAVFNVVGLDYYSTYRIGDLTVETPKGNHAAHGKDEASINYLVTNTNGMTLLYATDTGYYTDETWEYLTGKHVDILIMDCTFAGRTDRGEYPSGHLDAASFVKMLERMTEIGVLDSGSRIYATHFNPHQGLSHDQIQARLDESRFVVTVAFDGLRVGFEG